MMSPIWIIAQLTIQEAQRRKIVMVALIMGLLFLILFGTGLHYILREFEQYESDFNEAPTAFLAMAGLYVTNFLVVVMSVLISVATLSAEIEARLIDTILTKPLLRWQLVLGKWLGFVILCSSYALLLAGGVLAITYWRGHYLFAHIPVVLLLMCLNAILMLSVTILGGTRLSTLANGVLAFMLFGVAFIGNWVESIGGAFRNEAAVNIGILTSLLLPTEAIWRKVTVLLQPDILSNMQMAGPFALGSEPSDAMIVYTVLYVLGALALAMWSFGRRDL